MKNSTKRTAPKNIASYLIAALLIVILSASVLYYTMPSQTATEQKPDIKETIQQTDKFLDIKEVTSKNGITAWLSEDHTLPIISIKFAFSGAGKALDVPEQQGLVQLLTNTLDEGAGNLTSQEFQKALNNNSITLSFSADRDNFYGELVVLDKYKEDAFNLMRLALTDPRFDEEPVHRMIDANIARIKSSMTNPNWIAARIMNDSAYRGHPYAMNSGGTITSLPRISGAALDDFRRKHLTKDRLIVSAAGAISANELKKTMEDIFGSLPKRGAKKNITDTSLQNSGKIFLYKKDIPQTIIRASLTGIDRNDPEFYAAYIMNFILGGSGFGSRLTGEIREKRGLTYGIHTWLDMMDHIDTLSLSTSTQNENVAEMLSLIKAELIKMQNEPVTDDELETAKSYLIGSAPLGLTSTNKISDLLLSLRLDNLPIDYLDKRAEILEQVTKEDVQKVAKRLLSPDNMIIILVGSPKEVA
jgi:zinc protease